ncbi:hypothetical protein SLEP1_g1025 [Rubroshorea leprosula]|uniref:Uncharacterized protein n=1 Tax=Rubroshorea leprosula TaxID=152421 RepID=A0AAV5HCH9_9ROSI|nr:hypothetical protein SLEP1_g1025 [Rubroshorea leprosula]
MVMPSSTSLDMYLNQRVADQPLQAQFSSSEPHSSPQVQPPHLLTQCSSIENNS